MKHYGGMFSSATDEWETPQDLFDRYDAVYHFALDPAATAENAKCDRFFTKEQDGLSQPWGGAVWLNPPYGRQVGRWVEKAYRESRSPGTVVVCLLPARTDTRWFHDYCKRGEVEFLRGRVCFGDGRGRAPFPSMIVVFKTDKEEQDE